MLALQGVTYIHPDGDRLFPHIDLTINQHEKIALIGDNGAGKSTLLKILSGALEPSGGLVRTGSAPYYLPQIVGQFNHFTVAQALGIEPKLKALTEILRGHVTDANLALLDNDWTIEERCREALSLWRLDDLHLDEKMGSLSGGQKTKVFLAGIAIHQPEIVLLDEPSNHLDTESRNMLYKYVTSTSNALVVVSHDRTLLNLLTAVCELSKRGITRYGGNYAFYTEQKIVVQESLNHELKNREKALRKAKALEGETLERKQKLDARGKKKQEKAGMPTIMMKTLKNNAEKSTARMKDVHTEKISGIAHELADLRKEIPDLSKMKVDLNDSSLHKGKLLVNAKDVNFSYGKRKLWPEDLNFRIASGERIVVKGANGTGKTTLIRLVLGELQPQAGILERAPVKSIYVDQDYSLTDNRLSVYEQAQQYNSGALQEHEVKIRLNRFLFPKEDWDKPCSALSGGEKMRLMLCSLTIGNQAPDIMVLDEPTNNLDIRNTDILTTAINEYTGTLLVASHDDYFLKQIGIERTIGLRGMHERD